MGGYAQFCIETLFGWVKSLIQQVWSVFTNQEGETFLSWIGENWKGLFLVLCIAGALIDLLVYIFRWEPIKVWKSYFSRRKEKKHPAWRTGSDEMSYYGYDIPEFEPEEPSLYETGQTVPAQVIPGTFVQDDEDPYPEELPEPPLQEGPVYSAPNMPVPQEYHAMYQRPEQDMHSVHPEYDPDPRSLTERNLEKVIGPRRRRLRVNELFRDTDENVVHYEAPQPVIDRTEAYHAPVYPRNWKDNGEDPS